MPSLVAVLLHPAERRPDPEPFELDVPRVIAVGTALWAVGAVVGGLLYWLDAAPGQVPVTCLAGIVLGGAWWWHERRRTRRRPGVSPTPDTPVDPT